MYGARACLPDIGICERKHILPGKLSTRAMQVISFKSTRLFKRGIWLSGAALMAFVAAPSVIDGSLRSDPASRVFALGILAAFFVYFLRKTQIHHLRTRWWIMMIT